jgi:hypothetical protein
VSPATQTIPALANNTGYWCTLSISVLSRIGANWQDNGDPNNELRVYSTNPNPFAGRPDPIGGNYLPNGQVGDTIQSGSSISTLTSNCQPVGTYSVYFFNHGGSFAASTGTVATFPC